jgi:hypothetical protein
VSERVMADVVGEGEGLGEFAIEAEGLGDGGGDLGDFKCVGQAAAGVVAGEIACQPGEDLGFSSEAPECAGVKNAGGIAGEVGSIGMWRFGMLTLGEATLAVDGDAWRERLDRIGV